MQSSATDRPLQAAPTLVVLAAGMGSRFGGLKQIAPIGPNGETLLEYSIFDAARAGFGKAIVVIAAAFEPDFCEQVLPRLATFIDVDYVLQDRADIGGRPRGRFGTAHAVLAAAPRVDGPFAVINADDFYGRAAYEAACAKLADERRGSAAYVVMGYELGRTLSPAGPVSRAIIEHEGTRVTGLTEHLRIVQDGDRAESDTGDGRVETFPLDTPVSMNFWGFSPALFDGLLPLLDDFLGPQQRMRDTELRLPDAVIELVRAGAASVDVELTDSDWFGMTYREDHDRARRAIRQRIDAGDYPARLTGTASGD